MVALGAGVVDVGAGAVVVAVPATRTRPIDPGLPAPVNQRLPSGPVVMSVGSLPAVTPEVYCVIVPAGVIVPIAPRAAAAGAGAASGRSGRSRSGRTAGLGEPEVAVRAGTDAGRLTTGWESAVNSVIRPRA